MDLKNRTPLPSVNDAQRLSRILADDESLAQAASLAVWLILEKNKSKHGAKRIAARKYGATQAATQRLIEQIIPQWLFDDRQRETRPPGSSYKGRKGQGFAEKEMIKQRNRHLEDI